MTLASLVAKIGRITAVLLGMPLSKTKLFLLFLILSAQFRLLCGNVSAAEERIIETAPVRVVASYGPEMFPESWREAPVSASAVALPADQFPRVRRILDRALIKYPPQVLKQHLKAVYAVAKLRYCGVTTSGTNSLTCVYLMIGDVKAGFTDDHIEGVFHAEFSSILLRNLKAQFEAESWQAVNPPGFTYLGNGVEAVKQKKHGLRLSEDLHKEGFLVQYSQSTLENDFNGIACRLFGGQAVLWDIARRFPKIQRKVELTFSFYQKVDPAFTENFFRSLVKTKQAAL